ncbi:DNA polymerase III subunit gamma/tau [candidate division WOR-3 bacterium]|nr:DNA polymerase III subunit gamma/tau [candidate division WOR-3 bacterium]
MEPRTFSLRYRPQNFEELFDQEHVKRTLTNAIQHNRLVHAYLFAGPRGVGKTTTARILAKSLNCVEGPTVHPCDKCSTCLEIKASKSLDVLEIDGASNRGIDQIRELRENVRYRPTSGHYRIYIIDEVHMLTTEAFNALLKTLEEPPRHVIFIFATTEPHKVPATILSRCQRFDFKRIAPDVIAKRLEMIIEKENLDVSEDAVRLIADIADGGLRDAESVLEQITTFKQGRVTAEDVTELLGIVPYERFSHLLKLVGEKDEAGLLAFLEQTFAAGYDVAEFYFGMVGFLRALLFTSLDMRVERSSFPENVLKRAKEYRPKELARMLERFLKSEEAFKRSREKVIFIETMALSLLDMGEKQPVSKESSRSTKTSTSPQTSRPKAQKSPLQQNHAGVLNTGEGPASIPEEGPSKQASENDTKKVEGEMREVEESVQSVPLKQVWKRFIKETETEESFVTLALQASEIIETRNNLLTIGINNNPELNIGRLKAEQSHLEERLSRLAGQKMRLEFKATKPMKKESRGPKSKPRSAVEDVLDIFKGDIVR